MPRVTTLSVSRDDIIKAALRKLKVIGEGETPSTEDYTNCAFGLNIMLKEWETDGIYLWKTTEISITTVASNASYQIGPTATGTGATVTHRPLRVIEGTFIRDSSSIDTPLTPISRQEYNNLSNKTSAGIPTQFFYDPQLDNGVLYLYPRPSDATHTVHLVSQIPIYDFASSSETLDMPQEGYQAAVYGLADVMMDEYTRPDAFTAQRITVKSQEYRNKLADWAQEDTSIFFMPSFRR